MEKDVYLQTSRRGLIIGASETRKNKGDIYHGRVETQQELSVFLDLFDEYGCPKRKVEVIIKESTDYEKAMWKAVQTDRKQVEIEGIMMEVLQGGKSDE